MSIVSQQTFDRLAKEEKETIMRSYLHFRQRDDRYGKDTARILEDVFGTEVLNPGPQTYGDVAYALFADRTAYAFDREGEICEMAMVNYGIEMPLNCASSRQAEKLRALNMLLNVARSLNGEWRPDWKNRREPKWYLSVKYFDGEPTVTQCYSEHPLACAVFFRSEVLAMKAVEILGRDVILTALSTDY